MLRKLLDWWDIKRQLSRRYVVSKVHTGKCRGTVYTYIILKRFVLEHEYKVLTELPSHDVTDETHYEWNKVWAYWQWGWK